MSSKKGDVNVTETRGGGGGARAFRCFTAVIAPELRSAC